ncbi:protein white-like [Bolinopsis microptera]|uniref:protein white-like n=1 Tax=Bolinopsis microptera TaxID=2820187 RepID=UPI00307A0FCD
MSISDVEQSEGSHLLDSDTADYTKLKQSEYREPLLGDTSQQDVYTLPLEEDASDNLKSVTLSWRDLSASTENYSKPRWFKNETGKYFYKDILKRVSGIVEPGEMMGIIGPKGAGKTSMLMALAQKKMDGVKVKGTLQVNGWQIDPTQMALISAYVDQEDNFMEHMTVRETIMFHVNMRMDKQTRFNRKVAKANAILEKLDLLNIEHTRIGQPGEGRTGITHKERKTLALGLEMLEDPLIIFLDEPVKGMEPRPANRMLRQIKEQASPNQCTLVALSQPSSEAFALLDKICLMADGHTVFLGAGKDAVKLFETLGRPCPELHNPADHFMNELALDKSADEKFTGLIETYTNFYRDSEDFKKLEEAISYVVKINKIKPDVTNRKRPEANKLKQFVENSKRAIMASKRISPDSIFLVAQGFITSLFIALAYFGLKNNQNVAQNKAGLFFFQASFLVFSWATYTTSTVVKQFPVFQKEYQLGINGIFPFFFSILIQVTSNMLLFGLLQVALFYFITGLHISAAAFFTAWFTCSTIAWVSATLGIFTGSVTSNVRKAKGFNVMIALPCLY